MAALLIWPLFATGTRLIRREYIPIPPYGGHRVDPQNMTHKAINGIRITHGATIYDPPPLHGSVAVPRQPAQRFSTADSGPDIPGMDLGPSLNASNSDNIIAMNIGGPPPPRPDESATNHALSVPIRRSEGVQSALLIRRIEPRYPPLAIQAYREGTVQLHAVIARDGSIESLEVLSGDPLFIQSALGAVRQWRYRPTLLGGEPVEVETYITVNFRLSHD